MSLDSILRRCTPVLPFLCVIGAINAGRPDWLGAVNEVVAIASALALGRLLSRRPG